MMENPPTTVLSATALAIGYHHGDSIRYIASDLNLALQAGEFVCLLGPNGTGKSTLIRSLSGMQAPLSGAIRIAGCEFHRIPPRQRARLVSVVLTETLPPGMMDAYAMVALGRHPYSGWFGGLGTTDHARIEWALAAIGASDLARRQVAELSDGERQKISIARALAQQASVMLLDEPTAYLDLPRRVELMRILRDLAHSQGLALLLSTHDLDLALRFADRLWVLNHTGGLIQGYPEAIAMSGQFASVFASDNLEWDPTTGSFRAHPTPCLRVHVAGDGVPVLWTRRALERLGFGLTGDAQQAVCSIRITSDGEWHLTRRGSNHICPDITHMIEWFLDQDWRDG